MPATSQVSKGNFTPCSSQNRIPIRFAIGTGCEPLDSYGSSRCLDQLVSSHLLIVWLNSLIIPFGCFVFTNFTSCVPLCSFRLSRLSTLLRVHPPLLWFVKHYYNLRVLHLLPCALCPFVRFGGLLQTVLTNAGIFNYSRFSSSAFAPVCKSRRLYPGCS